MSILWMVEVATFLPNLVQIGQKLRERHQFFKLQDGGSRHVEFWLEALCEVVLMLIIEVVTFLPNLVKIGKKLRERHQFFKLQDGGSRHVEFRLPVLFR